MSCLTLDKVEDLISTFDAPLLISMYKNGDELNWEFKELINDTYFDVKNKYNFISLDVSNMPELCSKYYLHTPCTVLFLDGRCTCKFSQFASHTYIEVMTSMRCGDDTTVRMQPWVPIHLEEEEDDEIVF